MFAPHSSRTFVADEVTWQQNMTDRQEGVQTLLETNLVLFPDFTITVFAGAGKVIALNLSTAKALLEESA